MDILLNMAIGGIVTGGLILLIKRLFRNKLTPKWHLYIWLILAARLLFPILPESGFSLQNAVPTAQNITTVQNEAAASTGTAEKRLSSYMEGSLIMKSPVNGTEMKRSFSVPEQRVNLALAVWVSGFVLMGCILAGSYFIFSRRAKKYPEYGDAKTSELLKSCSAEAGVYWKSITLKSGGSTPMLHGLFRPVILIPEGYTGEELRHVLLHELCHHRHKDILINMVCSAILCVYWFNPVIWVCFHAIRRDIEILCDERVIEITGERKSYSRTLLKTALKRNQFLFATTSMQNGEKEVAKRIKHIAAFKKPRLWISVLAALILIAAGVVCLTDAPSGSAEGAALNPQDYQPEISYRADWLSTAGKLLDQYFKNYVRSDLPRSSDISGYRIGEITTHGDGEASWSVIYPGVTVMTVDYTLKGKKTQIYQDRLAVFRLDVQGNAKFLGFVADEDIHRLGEAAAILYTISITDPDQSPEALLKLKMPYIGDHTRVGRILRYLPLTEYSTGLELHTKEEPYGLTVNYDMTQLGDKVFLPRPDKAMTDSSGWDPNPYLMARMYKNSMILLSLIDNCSAVEFRITGISETGVPYTYSYYNNREKASYDLSQDPRSFTANPDAFNGFINELELIQIMY